MMSRLSIKVVFVFIVILVAIPHFLKGEIIQNSNLTTDKNIGLTQGALIQKHETSCGDVLRQYMVLWDTTHGVYLNYHPYSRYTDLVALLADSGYTIECCGTGIHTIDLSLYDVIVICVGSSWNSPYTQEEVDSLVNYYNQGHERVILTGDINFCENVYFSNADNIPFTYNIFEWLSVTGGIFIMGDDAGCNNSNINPVADAFRMTAGLSNISPSDLYFSNFAAHPIFDDISEIYYRAAGEIAATSPAEVVAWTDANEPVIAVLEEVVGIETQDKKVSVSTMKIVPNPFTDYAKIFAIEKTSRIRIYDVSGKLVRETESNIIGSDLENGIYFLKVEDYKPLKVIKLK